MNNSVFRDPDSKVLANAFDTILKPKATQPTKVVSESVEPKTPKTKRKVVKESQQPIVASKFNEVFSDLFSEDYDYGSKKKKRGYKHGYKKGMMSEMYDEEGGEDMEMDYDSEGEEEMVSVPKALIKELYGYMDDMMGSEDESDVDDIDFELPEESYAKTSGGRGEYEGKTKALKSKGSTTSPTGSTTQKSHALKKSAGKTGMAYDKSEARSGKPAFLKSLLGSYMNQGSTTQKNHKLKVGDDTTVK